jgi:Predicted membrane protein
VSNIELCLIAFGLSMDAFAVAVCKGLTMKKIKLKQIFIIALFFGGFQAGMPLIGYFLGSQFDNYIRDFDHWIVFILLSWIGFNMIKAAFKKEDEVYFNSFKLSNICLLAIATSIDALAVGIGFAFLRVEIILAVTSIGVITFICSFLGVFLGHFFGSKIKSSAEITGGVILILIGFKILLEHLIAV